MQNTKKILISFAIFFILAMPIFSLAANTPLVTCDNCTYNDLMTLIYRVIKFILYDMVIPIAAIMFAYAGFLLVTAGGEAAHARTKAKSIFWNAVFGLIIAVAAFLIVKTILSILGYNGPGLNGVS